MAQERNLHVSWVMHSFQHVIQHDVIIVCFSPNHNVVLSRIFPLELVRRKKEMVRMDPVITASYKVSEYWSTWFVPTCSPHDCRMTQSPQNNLWLDSCGYCPALSLWSALVFSSQSYSDCSWPLYPPWALYKRRESQRVVLPTCESLARKPRLGRSVLTATHLIPMFYLHDLSYHLLLKVQLELVSIYSLLSMESLYRFAIPANQDKKSVNNTTKSYTIRYKSLRNWPDNGKKKVKACIMFHKLVACTRTSLKTLATVM